MNYIGLHNLPGYWIQKQLGLVLGQLISLCWECSLLLMSPPVQSGSDTCMGEGGRGKHIAFMRLARNQASVVKSHLLPSNRMDVIHKHLYIMFLSVYRRLSESFSHLSEGKAFVTECVYVLQFPRHLLNYPLLHAAISSQVFLVTFVCISLELARCISAIPEESSKTA